MCILRNNLFKFVFICLCTFVALSKAYADTAYYPAGHNGDSMCVVKNLGVTSGESGAIKALWCPTITTSADGTTITLDATVLGTCSYTTTCSEGYHIQDEANTVKTKVETTLSNSIESESSVVLTAVCVKQEITCSAGTYLETGDIITSSSCATCPAGSYCPGGTFTYTGSAQGKIACPAGTSAGSAGRACALCSAGTTSSVGANTCTTCPNAQNVASSNGWVEPSLSDTSWTLSHTPTVNHLCEVNNCAEKYAYSVENHSGKNLFDKSQTKITTLPSMLSAQKPAYVAANVYTVVDSDSEIGSTGWVSINGEGIMIDYTPGDSFYVYFFNGGVPTSNAGYAWTLLDADGKALVKKESYMPGSIITPTAVEGARYFLVQWATGPSNITNYQNIIDGLMITKNQTATEYEPYSVSAYQNACNPCPAGSFCLGGQDTGTVCPIGSYSAGNTDKCTVCGATDAPADTKGKTTSGTGKTSCDAICENKDNNNVKTWGTASWNTTTHTADNVCKATACNASYAFTEKVQSGKNLFNPSASTTTIGAYFGLPAGQYAGQKYQLTISLKEGKTIPTGVNFGIVYKKAGSSSFSAYWLISSGNLQYGGKTNFNTISTTSSNVGIACFPQNQTTWNKIMDAFDIQLEAGTTSTAYEPYGPAYQNSCDACPAGQYCTGNTDVGHDCPIGSWSAGTQNTCTECDNDKTTVAAKSTDSSQCVACSNKTTGVSTWADNSFDKNTGTMSNLCSVTGCNTKYAYNSATLPSGYTRLEYIEADGTQQIDTGYKPSGDGTFGFALDIKFTNTSARTIFGYSVDTVDNGGYWEVAGGQTIYSYISTNITGNNYSVTDRNVIEGSMTLNSSVTDKVVTVNNVYINDVSVAQTIQRKTESIDGISTFKLPLSSSYPLHAYIYGITQHKDGELVRNLIPAKDSNGAVGMYDTVSRDFKTSAITGTAFSAGPEITMSGACTICPAGDYCTGGAEQKCDTGYYSLGGTSTCDSCVKGAYTNLSGQSACTPCQDGNTTSGTGQSTCNAKCLNNSGFVNTWTNVTWSATASGDSVTNSCKITNCSAGAYYTSTNSGNTNTCTACPAGSYKDATDGHTETSCDLCDPGKTSSMGATALSQCTACPNAVGVPTGASWGLPSWNETTKTVYNKCSLTECSPAYTYNNKMLPDDYTAIPSLKQIQTQTSGTGYIDTGYKTNANTKVETRFKKTEVSGNSRVFGNYESSSSKAFVLYAYSGSFYSYIGNSAGGAKLLASYPVDTNWHTVVLDAKNKKMIFDNEIISGDATLSGSPTENMIIFAGYATSTIGLPFYGEIEYFKIYEDDVLKHYFVPAKRNSDNTIGMYDTIEGKFYENKGTGTFTAPTTTVTQGVSSDYQNICSVCVAGNYCPGGTGDAAKQEACTVGSWSDNGASTCETCTPGKTTRGTGTAAESACEIDCPGANDAHFTNQTSKWQPVTWNKDNTVTNLCKFNSCVVGYHVTAGNYSSSNYSIDATADTCDANTIYIDWDENGGTPIDPNGSCEYDSTITFPAASATQKTNFRFNGWAL